MDRSAGTATDRRGVALMATVSCVAGYGGGGLGQHLAQIVEDFRSTDELQYYYSSAPRPDDAAGIRVAPSLSRFVMRYTPARFDSGWRTYVGSEFFDRAVASRIVGTDRHVGFSGQTLRTFNACQSSVLELVSPMAHVGLAAERYEAACRVYPIEHPWLNAAGIRKALAEYERADVIRVASDYVRESFLAFGVPERKLARDDLRVSERFSRRERRESGDRFRIVYVGALTVTKGVPLLLDAFSRLSGEAELVLVGGWASRGMRRFVQERLRMDARIRVVPGDPLEHLRAADVLVHPSYSDGFGYAPMEAIACGVPVVVTEDTGMSELVREGETGYVVPTGSIAALAERLDHIRRHQPNAVASTAQAGASPVSKRAGS
jgi:glycosyltransferase involved in cell wall biosynthesis